MIRTLKQLLRKSREMLRRPAVGTGRRMFGCAEKGLQGTDEPGHDAADDQVEEHRELVVAWGE
jgi:hypothetical protein